MNKIEKAIYDTKLHIKKLQEDRMILNAKLLAYEEQLETLEIIERDKHIPHHQDLKNKN